MQKRTTAPAVCILSVRLECKSDVALQAAVEALQGALGEAESVSRPYANHRDGNGGKRVYARFVVPAEKTQ